MTEVRVYMRHVRAARICSGGSRRFFAKHGLDWSAFLSDGIPVPVLEQIGDPIALKAAAVAKAEASDGQG